MTFGIKILIKMNTKRKKKEKSEAQVTTTGLTSNTELVEVMAIEDPGIIPTKVTSSRDAYTSPTTGVVHP